MSTASPMTDAHDSLERTELQDNESLARSRRLSEQQSEPPGQVPGYEIERPLGEGSFGSVWLARESKTGKQVAIKFYTHRRGLNWSLLSREVEKLAVLYTSRNIVGLLDVGWDHEPPYFVMEYLERGSLERRLELGALPVETAVGIARAVARALAHAHNSGILHCDLKPANILLDVNSEPRLGDFGQSRLTTEQSPALGTLFYMAPEQAVLNGVPDTRWDVYALGAVLYEMLTGVPPYANPEFSRRLSETETLEERLALYRRIVLESPRPDAHHLVVGVDRSLAEIVDRCLERDPNRRLPSVQALLDLLERREQSRAKRPLIALGFLGPILVLLAMYWIAESAIPRVVTAAEQNLVERALESDVVAARLLAESVQQELRARQSVLENLAELPATRELIALSQSLSDEQLLEQCTSRDSEAFAPYGHLRRLVHAQQQRLADERRTEDESWFVTDARGRQVFRIPPQAEGHASTLGRPFHWRDYFHGRGDDVSPATPVAQLAPRTAAGVTGAFRSQANDHFMVAIAVPVWNDDRSEVVGVLARTIGVPQLLRQWEVELDPPAREPKGEHQHNRFLVLADTRGSEVRLLDHPWMSHETLQPMSDLVAADTATHLVINPQESEALQTRHRSDRYQDPIAAVDRYFAGDWLAAAAPVGETGWLAIVQERREMTVEPVDDLRRVFVNAGLWSASILSALLLLLWYLIHRAST